MTTHTVHHNPVRSDVGPAPDAASGSAPTRWALAGLGAGIAGAVSIASSMAVSAVYDEQIQGDAAKIAAELEDFVPQMLVFHVAGMVSAVLMIVFAAGLFRRLRTALPADSTLPMVAFSGVFGTAIVLVLGTGLDTEFIFATTDPDLVVPENLTFYNHWIGTIPWIWGLLGLSGVVLFAAARAGAVAKWIGWVGLLGGGLTLLLGISPLQYMAGMTGPIGLIVISLGFLAGDKAFRGGS